MRLLLDTHTFLWFVWDDPQLSPAARKLIESGENEIFLSAASVWEVAIKAGTGKTLVGEDVTLLFGEHTASNVIAILPVTLEHAGAVSLLPLHHKDPFDRLLIS